MKTYGSYIAGVEAPAEQWLHWIRSCALFDDAFGAIALKRALDSGAAPDAEDSRICGRIALTTEEQSLEALRAARAAQAQWARRPLSERMHLGHEVHRRLKARKDEFIDVLVAEGHPYRLAEWEVAGAIQGSSPQTLAFNASMMEQRSEHLGREVRLVRKPDGVVGLVPPRNAAASNSLLGVHALIAGNTVIVKAPRSTPYGVTWAWRELVVPVLEEMGAPAGTLGIICGDPEMIIDQWVESPELDDLIYFGGSARGIELGKRLIAHGKKPVLELAGNDGVLVWRDADLPLAARALAECFYGSSQICMVPKYALVHPEVIDELTALLQKEIAGVRPGRPESRDALLSPVLSSEEFDTVLAQALDAGAELVQGGSRMNEVGDADISGIFLQPTLLRVPGLALAGGLRAVREETFYPMLPLVRLEESGPQARCTDAERLQEAIDFMNANPYGLRNSLWSGDPEHVEAFCRQMRNGGLLKINDSHIGFVPGLPTHGGTGLTGGPHGECNFPMLRTSSLQGISIATGVHPPQSVFDSALPPA